MPKFEIVVIVWGDEFIELLAGIFLPSLLAPGNLPSWPYSPQSTLVIYSRPAEQARIDAAPVMPQIKAWIPVAYRPAEPGENPEKYSALTRLHSDAVSQAIANQASLILPMPDSIFPDGFLRELAREIEQPCALVLALSLRVAQESFRQEVRPDPASGAIALSPARCVDLVFRHLHPMTAANQWSGATFTNWPSHIWHFRDDQAIELRGLHLHPIFIRAPVPFPPDSRNTIDGVYLQAYAGQPQSVRQVRDERLLLLSLAPGREKGSVLEGPVSISERLILVDRFARECCIPLHRASFSQPIVLQGSGPLPGAGDDRQALGAIEALLCYWVIEKYYCTGRYAEMLKLFSAYKPLLDKYLQIMYFFHCFYLVALAFYHLKRWDELKLYAEEYGFLLNTLYDSQFAYRTWMDSPLEFKEPYVVIFQEQKQLPAELAAQLAIYPIHVVVDETNSLQQQQLAEMYASLGLDNQALVIHRLNLTPDLVSCYMATAAAVAIPPSRKYQDIGLWAFLYDRNLFFLNAPEPGGSG